MKIKLLLVIASLIISICILSIQYAAWQDILQVNLQVQFKPTPIIVGDSIVDDSKENENNAMNEKDEIDLMTSENTDTNLLINEIDLSEFQSETPTSESVTDSVYDDVEN
jgi:hypothetical protein